MPSMVTLVTSPVSTDPFTVLNASSITAATNALIPKGEVEAYFRNDSATAVNLVLDASTAAAAATDLSEFRSITIPGSTTVVIPYQLDPSRAWVRSGGAAHSSLYMMLQW